MSPSTAPRPAAGRRLLFTGLAALATLVAIELIAAAALWRLTGAVYTPARGRIERQAVETQARERSNQATPVMYDGAVSNPFSVRAQVIHPFVGYALDPQHSDASREINRLGFFATPPPDTATEPLQIGVFGGSVANGLVRHGRQTLIDALQTSPALGDRPIWLRSFAMGGYKQPQQLMALNYLLTLGESLDIVINLDGYNDIALGPDELARFDLSPWYPRGWPRRMAALPDVAAQRTAGEIAFLEGRRAERAQRCAGVPLAWSPTCHLLWTLGDRRTQKRLHTLRMALSKRADDQRRFATNGPPWPESGDAALLAALAEGWARASRLMQAASESAGARYYHFLQPNQYVAGSKPMGRAERQRAIADHPRAPFVQRGYPLLVAAGQQLAEDGVRFVDLRMVFADVEEPLYIDTCCHLNAQGRELLATAIARHIIADLAAE